MDSAPAIKSLIVRVREGNEPPGSLAEIGSQLSGWYATLASELEDIEVFMADRWLSIRETTKTDGMADRTWDATEEGKRRTRLRIQLKYIEKMLSQIKVLLRVKEGESWNRY